MTTCRLRNVYGQDFHLVELREKGRTISEKVELRNVFLTDSSLRLVVLLDVFFWSNINCCCLSAGLSPLYKTEADVMC